MTVKIKEFVDKSWIDFSKYKDAVVIGFYRKGWDNLTMEILKQNLEKAIIRKKVDDEND